MEKLTNQELLEKYVTVSLLLGLHAKEGANRAYYQQKAKEYKTELLNRLQKNHCKNCDILIDMGQNETARWFCPMLEGCYIDPDKDYCSKFREKI